MKGKRILTTALAAMTLLTAPAALPQQTLPLNAITASAANNYIASGFYGNFKWTLDGFGTLTISGGNYETIYSYYFTDYRFQIKSIIIESDNITISNRAFQNYPNLKSLKLPELTRRIGSSAFENCTSLTDITFPYGVQYIDQRAFANCTALKRVILPQYKVDLGEGVFQNCTALTYVGFPYTYNGEMVISPDIFRGCRKNITIAGPEFSDAYYFAKNNKYPFNKYTLIRFTDKEETVNAKSGETVKFTVHPVNDSKNGDTFTYQWMYYDGSMWKDLTWTGAKTPTLSVPVEASREKWIYECRVYSGSGSYESSPRKKINVKAAVTQQPKSTKQVIGTTATFSLRASGNNLTYQWQVLSGPDWINLKTSEASGATSDTLRIPVTAANDGKIYRCIVKSSNRTSDISCSVMLTAQTNIILHPVSVTQKAGTTAKFYTGAAGSSLSYQWQYHDGSRWKDCTWSGSKTATLSVPVTAARNGYKFRCIVKTSNAAKAITDTATLTVK